MISSGGHGGSINVFARRYKVLQWPSRHRIQRKSASAFTIRFGLCPRRCGGAAPRNRKYHPVGRSAGDAETRATHGVGNCFSCRFGSWPECNQRSFCRGNPINSLDAQELVFEDNITNRLVHGMLWSVGERRLAMESAFTQVGDHQHLLKVKRCSQKQWLRPTRNIKLRSALLHKTCKKAILMEIRLQNILLVDG